MSLEDVLDAARERRKTLAVHGANPGDLPDRFESRNVDVVAGDDPPGGVDDPYVTVDEDGDFQAAVSLAAIRSYFDRQSADERVPSSAEHALHELLDDSVFASLSTRQLTKTAVEFEDRAYRTGRGTLHAGFQTWTAFREQADRYERMARETDLDVEVYLEPGDGGQSVADGVTVHETTHRDVGEYWFVVYDGGDTDQQCALVAQQTGSDAFEGVWTYDPSLVETALSAVDDIANPQSA
ncbi:MAG: DICT sensory domain-containing protein [Halobacterium sp.]